jgi:hypothetical protein
VHRRGGAQQDREAQHKTVEAILAEAALANAQLAVAKAVLRSAASAVKAEFRREGATVEEADAKAEEAVKKMATQLVFGRVPATAKAKQARSKPEVKVLYFRSLSESEEDDGKLIPPPAEHPVQLAICALS